MASTAASHAFDPVTVAASAARAAPVSATRDPRLDFFRGIAMYIILIAHVPSNVWANWIPARFGFSDATEIFVFCSGMASAIAFGNTFERRGWWVGTARVVQRVWQVYWAHICLFLFVAMSMAAIDLYLGSRAYTQQLNLFPFFNNPMPQLVGLFTLTYVPNYFDILPMYLVILAMMPVVMALAGVSLWLLGLALVTLWLAANLGHLPLPAEPWSNRQWFFDPFGWQLLFFTGFAFMRGWLPAPPVSKTLIWAAAIFLVVSAPFGSWKVFMWISHAWPDLGALIRQTWAPLDAFRDKTEFGVLRYVHFLALAYLAWVAVGAGGARLLAVGEGLGPRIKRRVLAWITKVGQQSLAVFVTSMALAQLIGAALDFTGRNPLTFAIANLGGFAFITLVAYGVAWFKATPWKRKPA